MDAKTKAALMGKRVKFTKRLVRHVEYIDRLRHKRWAEVYIKGEGWIVGFRTLQDGYTTWEGEEVGNAWTQKSRVPCVLIATGTDAKHVRVPLSEVA